MAPNSFRLHSATDPRKLQTRGREEQGARPRRDLQGARSAGSSLDHDKENLTIPEVIEHYGEAFDMAVETLQDDLNHLRSSLDEVLLSRFIADESGGV